jgi:hypothetical protein
MSASSSPMFEAQLVPYQEHVAMKPSTRFYLFLRDVEIYNEQGDFSADDWQVLLKMSQSYEAEQRKVDMVLMQPTAKLIQSADTNKFAQQTALMLIKLAATMNQLNADMMHQTLKQLTADGKQLLLQKLTPQPDVEEETVTDWQKIADKEPQLLYKMYKPIFDHMPNQP